MRLIILFMICVLWAANAAFADDAVFVFSFTEPVTNSDGSQAYDLSHATATFLKDDLSPWVPSAASQGGAALAIAANVVTVPMQFAYGGKRNQFQATLPYPNGGSESGIIRINIVDLGLNVGGNFDTPITASLASTVGAPGEAVALGVCTP